ncbi:hypothetical protein SUDANB106_03560 [Streptomyces sp. enrichment culture]
MLDAVVCVHFAGANLNRVLTAALEYAEWTILVPQEVCDEIRGKDRKYPGLERRWAALESSRYVRVLPRLVIGEASQARAVQVLEALRDAEFEQAIRRPKDLGECVVVAQGVRLREQGHQVTLLMDDRGGLAMAADWDLTCATIEDVLVLAVHAGCFRTVEELARAYRKLQEYGSGLPGFRDTLLGAAFRHWEEGAQTP